MFSKCLLRRNVLIKQKTLVPSWCRSVVSFKPCFNHKWRLHVKVAHGRFGAMNCRLCLHQNNITFPYSTLPSYERHLCDEGIPLETVSTDDKDCKAKSSQLSSKCYIREDIEYSYESQLDLEKEKELNDNARMVLETIRKSNKKLEMFQQVLSYSDTELLNVIKKVPRLKFKHCTQKAVTNCKILLQNGYDRKYIKSLFKWRTSSAILLQVEPEDFRIILKDKIPSGNVLTKRQLCHFVERRIMASEEDHFSFLSKALHCSKDTLLSSTNKQDQYFIAQRSCPSLLKEKVDYLVAEGISLQDIANYVAILRYSLHAIQETICRIQVEYGELNIKFLKSLLLNKNTCPKPNRNSLLMTHLGIASRDILSPTQRHFIGQMNAVLALETLQYLQESGFSQTDIRQCIYILRHPMKDIGNALKKAKKLKHVKVQDDKSKLINATLYLIEFPVGIKENRENKQTKKNNVNKT